MSLQSGPPRQNPRPRESFVRPRQIDDLDRAIVELLIADGRLSNAEVARRVGLPESTCAGRIRALRESDVIAGIHADVDHVALGRPIEAMVALRFAGHTRGSMDSFRERIAAIPGVIAAYHVAGADDFLVHVTAPSSDGLRDLVLDHLTSVEGVGHAQTSIVFERIPGARPVG
ncbi:Lrp/AsnC family transcriptional regulator [Luteipulveratus mongoliensis]|uniref:AsnC family transcriptional regulator n=1 Tax=Luteipulveratus mongoliensis TaxID=571913 RepID=A0A0K1JJX1_9MICO|nr:Lrp/AsnC family transcriptional regulator [Luteipulveratus mongoliensis]AKU16870.1 AsnC family transcriptional regulator [Luteipulveratus mongoliensis]